MTQTKSPLGQRIIWARRRKGISQERLAEMIGTSRRHMLRIETGKVRRPGSGFIALIAEATDQPVEFFADETSNGADLDDEDSEDAVVLLTTLFQRAVDTAVREAMRKAVA